MVKHFDHVTVVVRDVEAAKRFFSLLGFEHEQSVVISGEVFADYMGVPGIEADHVTLVLAGAVPRTEVQLLGYRAPAARPNPTIEQLNTLGYNHVCFAVEDLEGEVRRLVAGGIETRTAVLDFHGRKLVFLRGPEGITVELAERHEAAESPTHSLEFAQTVEAPRSLVCRAWTDPARLKSWYRPDDSWSTPLAEIDLRVGGAYRIGLTPPGASTFYEVGTYREVALPDRLVYTLRFEGKHPQFEGAHLDQPTGEEMETYETVITIEFHELSSARTRVAGTHAGYRTEVDRDRHRVGWRRFLEHLAAYCAAEASVTKTPSGQ